MLGTSSAGHWQVVPQFECGIYLLSGKVQINSANQVVLVVRGGTPAVFDVILLGGNLREKMDAVGTYIGAQIYVPRPSSQQSIPMVFLQKILPPNLELVNPILARREICGKLPD